MLGSTGKGKMKKDVSDIWEDKEVRFDIPITYVFSEFILYLKLFLFVL